MAARCAGGGAPCCDQHGAEILDRSAGVALSQAQASAAAERRGQEDGRWDHPEPFGRGEQSLPLVESILLGTDHHEPRCRETAGEVGPGLDAGARFELAAGQLASLVGDLGVLPERAGDQVEQRHLLRVGPQGVHGKFGVLERIGVHQRGRRGEGERADGEPVGIFAMEAARQQATGSRNGIGRVVAAHNARRSLHQPFARGAAGGCGSFTGDHLQRLRVAGRH
jgi:hypothetical protein